MLWDCRADGVENIGEVSVSAEHEHCGFCVAPAEVGEELVDGLRECLFTFPELAFTDEDVATLRSDEDVSFSFVVERFAGGLSFEVALSCTRKWVRRSSSPILTNALMRACL
jgi:hypothetical protein